MPAIDSCAVFAACEGANRTRKGTTAIAATPSTKSQWRGKLAVWLAEHPPDFDSTIGGPTCEYLLAPYPGCRRRGLASGGGAGQNDAMEIVLMRCFYPVLIAFLAVSAFGAGRMSLAPSCVDPECQGELAFDPLLGVVLECAKQGEAFPPCDASCPCGSIVIESGFGWYQSTCTCGGADAPEDNYPYCYEVWETNVYGTWTTRFVRCQGKTDPCWDNCWCTNTGSSADPACYCTGAGC